MVMPRWLKSPGPSGWTWSHGRTRRSQPAWISDIAPGLRKPSAMPTRESRDGAAHALGLTSAINNRASATHCRWLHGFRAQRTPGFIDCDLCDHLQAHFIQRASNDVAIEVRRERLALRIRNPDEAVRLDRLAQLRPLLEQLLSLRSERVNDVVRTAPHMHLHG